jgi:TPP-dependent pyruvate/acetoin dehydrogenase alpha subunit
MGCNMPLTNEQKMALFRNLVRAMTFDQLMLRLIRSGRLVGFYHEGSIAMAPGVAAGSFLEKSDILWPHLRGHGIAHMVGKGIDITTYFAEHMGRVTGCCKGRSSYHCSFPDDHVHGWSGNMGANFPMSVGYGFSAKYKKSGQVVMSCSGDGSYGEGRAHEAMLMAANWKLPVIFWCENNQMSQHTAITDIFPGQFISALAAGYGIPAKVVDGHDLFACGEAALSAIDHARQGKGPIFIESVMVRPHEHSVGSVNAAGTKKRDPEQMAQWKATLDPQKAAAKSLLEERLMTQKQIKQIIADAGKEADAIEEFCEQSPKAIPPIEELIAGVYAT